MKYKSCGVEYSSYQAFLNHIKDVERFYNLSPKDKKDALAWIKKNYPNEYKNLMKNKK